MEKRNMTCITCPMGCSLEVILDHGKVLSVTGNTCPGGEKYAREECIHPVRVLTATVSVIGGCRPVVSVKTASPIPRELLFSAMEELAQVQLQAPVKIGQIVLQNICQTETSVVTTSGVQKAY